MSKVCIGLGDHSACLRVFIGNTPIYPKHFNNAGLCKLRDKELTAFVSVNSNHWRKVFNIYAKVCFELFSDHQVSSWQEYREHHLFRQGENHALMFSPWSTSDSTEDSINIICGKTYGESLGLMEEALALQDGFYKTPHINTIITPYFDYRALSNAKVSWLVDYIRALQPIKRHL